MSALDQTVQGYKERAEKAEEETKHLKTTLELERELYTNIRELSKAQDKKINALKDAYRMQIDLVEALEKRIDNLEKRLA